MAREYDRFGSIFDIECEYMVAYCAVPFHNNWRVMVTAGDTDRRGHSGQALVVLVWRSVINVVALSRTAVSTKHPGRTTPTLCVTKGRSRREP